MKNNIFIATFFLMTSLASQVLMANETCKADAEKIAELAINAKAEKFSHTGFVDKTSTLHIRDINTSEETISQWSLLGSIYRADYTVLVELDGSCSLVSIRIKE